MQTIKCPHCSQEFEYVANPKKVVPESDHQKLRWHVCKTYKTKNINGEDYLWNGEDGKVAQWCLLHWTVYECMALWDLFVDRNWDWEKDGKIVKVPRSLRSFQSKLRVLMEESGWKVAAKKYEAEKYGDSIELKTEGILKKIPEPPTAKEQLENKIKLLKMLQGKEVGK